MCKTKISLAVVALWILFSFCYPKNVGTLQADLGNSCSYPFHTVNSHIVDSFSCHHMKTGPLVVLHLVREGLFSLDAPPWTRPLQADAARLHQTAWFLFAEKPLWQQTSCLWTGRQHIFANCSHILICHSLLVGNDYRKNCR